MDLGSSEPSQSEGAQRAHIPIFVFEDYREFLRYLIDVRRDVKGIRSRLAEAASCQPSYLSQVLTGVAGFSLDQLRGIARYLALTEIEWEYLRELGIMDRAAASDLRDDCRSRLGKLRESWQDRNGTKSARKLKPTPDDISWYTSTWIPTAVCAAIHSKALRRPAALARALGLKEPVLQEIGRELEERGFIERTSTEWLPSNLESIYLGSGAYRRAFRYNWFLRGMSKGAEGYQNGCHKGGTFVLTRAEYESLKERVAAEFGRFFSALPSETTGDVVVHYGIDLFEA